MRAAPANLLIKSIPSKMFYNVLVLSEIGLWKEKHNSVSYERFTRKKNFLSSK